MNIIQSQSAKDTHLINNDRLMERAQKLDVQALAQIHDRYYPAVYRYVRYRLDNESVVEDLSSEVFLRLLDHLHKQKGDIHEIRAWLLGTAANLVNDHLRHKYRRPTDSLGDHETIPGGGDPLDTAQENEDQAAVRQAIIQLTNDQQNVIALRFSQGLSIEETAKIMNKTAGAVKVLQFRALNTLRKLLGKEGNQ